MQKDKVYDCELYFFILLNKDVKNQKNIAAQKSFFVAMFF